MTSSPRIEKLNKLLALDANDPFVLYGLAQEYAKAGDTEKAVGFYDRCLAADPLYCYAYYHKARAQQTAGDIAAARQTASAGMIAAHKAGDGKAAGELSTLQTELAEG